MAPGGLGSRDIAGRLQGAGETRPQGFPVGQSLRAGPQVLRRLVQTTRRFVQVRHTPVSLDIGRLEGQQARQGRRLARLVSDHPATARQAQRQLGPFRMGVAEDPVVDGGFGELATALQDQGRPHPQVARGIERQHPRDGLELRRGVAAGLVASGQRGPEPGMAGMGLGERSQPRLGLGGSALLQKAPDRPDLLLDGGDRGSVIIRLQHATRPRSTRPRPGGTIIGCGALR